jgi:hypothetical protein
MEKFTMVIETETVKPFADAYSNLKDLELIVENYNSVSLIDVIINAVSILWPKNGQYMEVVEIDFNRHQVAFRGECPHCLHASFFKPVTEPYVRGRRLCEVAECQNCGEFILGIARQSHAVHGGTQYLYETHAPLGKPNDRVDKSIPEDIAKDFSEAIRCHWVEAFRAVVAMCRRSLEASCNNLGADGKHLINKIDNLADQGKITFPLKEMAHQVRIIGNAGALHPECGSAESLPGESRPRIEAIDPLRPSQAECPVQRWFPLGKAIRYMTLHPRLKAVFARIEQAGIHAQ